MSNRTDWWNAFNKLPRYSFLLGAGGGVQRVDDKTGNWIEQQAAAAIVDEMRIEIDALNARLDALKPKAVRP